MNNLFFSKKNHAVKRGEIISKNQGKVARITTQENKSAALKTTWFR